MGRERLEHQRPSLGRTRAPRGHADEGLAFDITLSNSESYAVVVDTRFTQPPSDVTARGRYRAYFVRHHQRHCPAAAIPRLASFGRRELQRPVADRRDGSIRRSLTNPNAPGSTDQTDCSETLNYDPATDHGAKSREHKCGIGIGVGYVHFDEVQPDQSVDILEYAYLDVGFHPEEGSTIIPSEVDLTLRNDNLGDNSFDTIEIYSDVGTNSLHYFEDRSSVPEGDSPFGNITDSRLWIRGLPSGTLTMMKSPPSSPPSARRPARSTSRAISLSASR